MQHTRDRKAIGRSKHKFDKGMNNGYIQRENKWETEIQQKQYDRTALSGIKSRQGPMGHHIKHANGRRKIKRNGKYETIANALNPQL
jgi:hypothetical protein